MSSNPIGKPRGSVEMTFRRSSDDKVDFFVSQSRLWQLNAVKPELLIEESGTQGNTVRDVCLATRTKLLVYKALNGILAWAWNGAH